MAEGQRKREIVAIVLCLAWVAGEVDAAGYVSLGGVYVAHMSGDTASATVHLVRGGAVASRALAIALFVGGVLAGALLSEIAGRLRLRARHALMFGAEAVVLVAAVFVRETSAVLALVAAAMGMQSSALRRISAVSIRTTAITAMLVTFGEEVASAVGDRDRRSLAWRRAVLFGAIWAAFAAGALSGVLAIDAWGLRALGLAAAVLVAVAARDVHRPLGACPPPLEQGASVG